MYSIGFNFEVPPESFIAEEDLLPDDEGECEPMIVSVELSNREKLVVCPRASATTKMDVGVGGRSMGDRSLNPMVAPMIVEIDMHGRKQGQTTGVQNANSNKRARFVHTEVASNPPPSIAAQSRLSAESSPLHGSSVQPSISQTQPKGSDVQRSNQNQNNFPPGFALANSINEKKEIEKNSTTSKIESSVAAYFGGGKKTKRASAAAAASKIKASMDETTDKAPSVDVTQQLASLKVDKKTSPTIAALLKDEDVATELVRNSREGEKRRGGASGTAKSKSAQRVAGQEAGKEMASQVSPKIAQPMAAVMTVKGSKREPRKRPSDKMEVDLSSVSAITPAGKAKETASPGRKGRQSQEVITAALLQKTTTSAPEPKSSLPSQQKTSPATQKTNPATQKTSPGAQKTSPGAQKTSPATQKTSPATQKRPVQPLRRPVQALRRLSLWHKELMLIKAPMLLRR